MKGFKKFLFQGNLVELAVAFIIATAFAKVVEAFTKIIIEILTKTIGNMSFDDFHPGGFVTVGPFITAVVSFVILAAVVYFALVKPYEAYKARRGMEDADPTTESLLADIRDLLANKK